MRGLYVHARPRRRARGARRLHLLRRLEAARRRRRRGQGQGLHRRGRRRSRRLRITAKGETSLLRKTDGAWKMIEPIADRGRPDRGHRRWSTASPTSRSTAWSTRTPTDLASTAWPTPQGRRRVQGRGRRHRDAEARRQDADAGRHLRGEGRRQARVPGRRRSRRPASTQAVRPARQEDPEGSIATRPTASRSPAPTGTAAMTRADSEWRVDGAVERPRRLQRHRGAADRLSTTNMSEHRRRPTRRTWRSTASTSRSTTVVMKAGSSAATLARRQDRGRQDLRAGPVAADGVHGRRRRCHRPEEGLRRLPQEGAVRVPRLLGARRVRARRAAPQTYASRRSRASGENAAEKWKVTVAGDGAVATRDADAAKMDDLLTKLVGLQGRRRSSADGRRPRQRRR